MAMSQYTTGKALTSPAGSPTTLEGIEETWRGHKIYEVILLSNFKLTRDKFLRPETASYLREVYSRIEAEKNSTEQCR